MRVAEVAARPLWLRVSTCGASLHLTHFDGQHLSVRLLLPAKAYFSWYVRTIACFCSVPRALLRCCCRLLAWCRGEGKGPLNIFLQYTKHSLASAAGTTLGVTGKEIP